MPAAVTVAGLVAFVNEPPFQNIVLPALVPVNVEVNIVHVILPEFIAEVIIGNVVFDDTATTVADEHPVNVFVTVNV